MIKIRYGKGETDISVIPFETRFGQDFKKLNLDWITTYFSVEEPDIFVLDHPQTIIDQGGHIFIGLYNNNVVGVCALKKSEDNGFELCKFAVDPDFQGLGVGRSILKYAIATAKAHGIEKTYLEGNTKLESSIHLYRKLGFKKISINKAVKH